MGSLGGATWELLPLPLIILCLVIVVVLGLMVPHIARIICGNAHIRLVPVAAVVGAIFLLCCDLFAKNAFYPKDLPIGIITSLIGGPFFLWMLTDKNYSFRAGK